MLINTYLTFNGECREAFEFYRSVFGGEFAAFQTFADAPAEMSIPEDKKNLVMHVSLPIGASTLMGSDNPFGQPVAMGTNFAVSVMPDSREKCDELFEELSADGEVTMALQETFWGAYYGSCKDQFGINWMFNCAL